FIGKTLIKWEPGQSGTLPVDRFAFTDGWAVNSAGVQIVANAATLGAPGEEAAAYLGREAVHLYRFTPVYNRSYNVTTSGPGYLNYAAAWADGSGTLMTATSSSYTSPAFVANKTVDIIIMVDRGDRDGAAYTLRYNEAP
ncbi:MAG: hypothetical protein LBD78_06970, partial [Spirochaetaceae bacterium]|nr:hypothetical protein [Spirochaetaceae bacterium]